MCCFLCICPSGLENNSLENNFMTDLVRHFIQLLISQDRLTATVKLYFFTKRLYFCKTSVNGIKHSYIARNTKNKMSLCLQGMEIVHRVAFSLLDRAQENLMTMDMEGMLKVKMWKYSTKAVFSDLKNLKIPASLVPDGGPVHNMLSPKFGYFSEQLTQWRMVLNTSDGVLVKIVLRS